MMAEVQEGGLEVGELSDHQLRENLQQLGFTPGPCTNTTRPVLERKLRRLSTDQADHVSNGAATVDQLPGSRKHCHGSERQTADQTTMEDTDSNKKVAVSIVPTNAIIDIPSEEGSSNKDIFLSYSRVEESSEFATELKKALESTGYSVWMDMEDIRTGSDWHSAIGEALKSCKALIAIITGHYLTSDYCKKELYMASSEKKLIFPVVLGDVDFSSCDSGILYAIASLNRTCFEDSSDKKAFAKLVEGLKHQVKPSISEKSLKSFTVDEVCAFVESLEIPSERFKANSVSGEDLIHLTDKDFKTELKMKPLQIRKIRRHMDDQGK